MDYNLSKGKTSFWEIINKELGNFSESEQNRIKEIAKSFEDSVAIMPDDNNSIYAARRLANSILSTDFSQQKKAAIDTVTTDVLVKYFSQAQTNSISKSHFVPKDYNLSGNFGKSQQAESDEFEKELRSNAEAEIDLLDDVDKSEMSIEGLRKKLLVALEFDTSKDEIPKIKADPEALGSITFSEDGQIERISCPHCFYSDVFQINHDKFGCFGCDNEFRVPMEIGDNLN